MIRASLRRPVAVTMTYTGIALLGIAAWRNIPLEMLPDEQLPRLSIRATWPGASPETVEAFLTAPLEAIVQQVKGVETVASTSTENVALIEIEFSRSADMDFARLDLSERLAALQESLPAGVGEVRLEPYVPEEFAEQNRPFLEYTFTGPYTLEALRAHLDDVVAPEISQIEGVSVVRVSGGRRRLLDIRLNEEQIAALGLTSSQVRRAIGELDLVQEAGAIREGPEQRTITIVNRPASADDVRRAVITAVGGTPVRVGDIADVQDTYEEAVSFARIDRRPAVTMYVLREIGANTVRVSDAVKARVAELEQLSPYGARFILEFDQSEDIRAQLTDLRTRALFAALVIFVVLVVFLRSFRSAALVFATIAFSVLIALNLIYFGGLTLNLLTLMGLAMGFGLVVDNSIVVLENVYRRWQGGERGHSAAEAGAKEVVLPILASTATTLIVFVPFVYLQGELRVFYVPLAIVVALTLVASIFVAFTFIPALAARLLDAGGGARRADASESARRPLYMRFYSDVVAFNLRHPWLAMAVTVGVFAGSYYVFDRYVTTWARWGGGWGSQSSYIEIRVQLPRGSNLERTDQLVQYFEDRLAAMPEPEQFTSTVQRTFGRIIVTFPDSLENTQVPVIIKEQMVAYSLSFTGADVRVFGYGPSFYGGGGGAPNYGIQVLGYNYLQVRDIAEDIGRRLVRLSRVVDVDTNSSAGNFYNRDRASEFVVRVERDRLAQHGLTVQELVAGMSAVIGGASLGERLKLGGEEVDFAVKLESNLDMDVLALRETLIATPAGRRIRLGDVVGIESREVLSRIRRENQQYERTVAYEFRGPNRLGDLYHEAIIAAVDVPPGYTVQEGRSRFFISQEEREQIWFVIAIALLLVYMVTAALFESLLQPLCVILTVPMALIGVYLIFFYTNAAFTREAYVGVIMMFGIVVNNAILLVDHVNRVRASASGLALHDAVLRGTLERVRPILMTTVTTVLGLLPLVLGGDGAGSNIWDALALVLIGGLLSSTLFVLTITPAAYVVLEGWRGEPIPRRLLVALLAVAGAGCSEPPPVTNTIQVTQSDSAGITVVTIAGSVADLPLWGLSPTPITEISGEAPPFLGSAGEVALLSDGRLLVEDNQTAELRLFAPSGEVLRLVGGRGDGPGEFRNLTELTVSAGDTAYAYDRRLYRVSVFNPSGDLMRTVDVGRERAGAGSLVLDAWPSGSVGGLLLHSLGSGETGPFQGPAHRDQRDAVLHALDAEGREEAPSVSFTGGYSIRDAGFDASAPFANRPLVASYGGRVLHGSGIAYELTLRSSDLRPVRIVRWDGWERPLTEAVLRSVRDTMEAGMEELRATRPDFATQLIEALFHPDLLPSVLPAVGSALFDDRGRIWVSRWSPTPELWKEEDSWHVLDADGQPLARVALPPESRLAAVLHDRVALIMRDSLEVQHVRVFAVQGGG